MPLFPRLGPMSLPTEPSSLVVLFAESKRALVQGQTLALQANELHAETGSLTIEALAFDAEGRFLSDGVLDQLSVSPNVGSTYRPPDMISSLLLLWRRA